MWDYNAVKCSKISEPKDVKTKPKNTQPSDKRDPKVTDKPKPTSTITPNTTKNKSESDADEAVMPSTSTMNRLDMMSERIQGINDYQQKPTENTNK